MHKAVDEMGNAATFHGYAPDLGYDFLRSAIVEKDYKPKGCDISMDEIFVSDGAKSDSGNIQEILAEDNRHRRMRSGISGICGLQCDGRQNRYLQSRHGDVE